MFVKHTLQAIDAVFQVVARVLLGLVVFWMVAGMLLGDSEYQHIA